VLLERYALASTALSRLTGERMAKEAGQSVEFHDFRPYQAGDELRYVDWRVYARSGRLYTRLYQAERTIHLHLLLDTSASMGIGHKARFARLLAQILTFVAQRDSSAQVHLFDGSHSTPISGRARIADTWTFIESAQVFKGPDYTPNARLKAFALTSRFQAGTGLVLVISDLFDETPLHPALTALKTRGLDASFLHVMAAEDLAPESAQLELIDIESSERLQVGPEEVEAYKQTLHHFLATTRSAVTQAGFRYMLLRSENISDAALERLAFIELIKNGILIRR
jgi:uncharacterized protein (DUF58 family)